MADYGDEVADMVEETASSVSTPDFSVLVVDCGATGSLVSLATLEAWQANGKITVHGIDPTVNKRYRVANGEVMTTVSQVQVSFDDIPTLGVVTFDAAEAANIPTLLGLNHIQDAVLDLRQQSLILNKRTTKLTRKENKNLVVQIPSATQLVVQQGAEAVSYTHLTLPTNREV